MNLEFVTSTNLVVPTTVPAAARLIRLVSSFEDSRDVWRLLVDDLICGRLLAGDLTSSRFLLAGNTSLGRL